MGCKISGAILKVCAFPLDEPHHSAAPAIAANGDGRRLAMACLDIATHQQLVREASDEAYCLLLKGANFPENATHYTTLDMLRWPEPQRVIARIARQAPRGDAAALLGDIEQRHIKQRTAELKEAAKQMRVRNAARFREEYLAVARTRVWRRFTDDLSSRIYHQRWDFLDCFRLLARSEWQIAVLYGCMAAYRYGISVATLAANVQGRLEAAGRGQVVSMSRGRDRQFGAPPA